MRFHFWASIKPIFENHVLSAVSGPFHPLYETKISNRWLSVVYGSITLKFFSWALGTISHQWFNRGNKIQKKVFLGHPIVNILNSMNKARRENKDDFQQWHQAQIWIVDYDENNPTIQKPYFLFYSPLVQAHLVRSPRLGQRTLPEAVQLNHQLTMCRRQSSITHKCSVQFLQ